MTAHDEAQAKASGEGAARIVYCHCAYAKIVPPEVKQDVLRRLSDSGAAFDAVPDLCEMSARKDPALAELAGENALEIVACYPRAVRWLFHAAGSPLPAEGIEILNMRTDEAEPIVQRALGQDAVAKEPEA